MKLLCVVPSYLPAVQFGGPIVSLHGLNKALTQKGVDVTVCTSNAGLEGKVDTGRETLVDGVKVTYFPFVKAFEFIGPTGWQYSPAMAAYLKANVKNFDIVYILSLWNYPVAVAAHCCRSQGVPYVISPRGMLYPYMFDTKLWKRLPYYQLVTKRDLREAAAVHYTASDEYEKCHRRMGLANKAIVVPNGLGDEVPDLGPLRPRLSETYPVLKEKKVILFLGRLHRKKGLDLLAPAYAELAKKRGDVYLVIAGNDEAGFSRTVKAWLAQAGVADKAILAGMLSGTAKWEAFAGSGIFVLPSYSENFGVAVVEAMACGLPVAISDQVAICDEVKHADAGIVIRNDAGELAKAMERIVSDKAAAQRMGENGQRLVKETFTWEKISDTMVQELDGIIRARKTR